MAVDVLVVVVVVVVRDHRIIAVWPINGRSISEGEDESGDGDEDVNCCVGVHTNTPTR